MHSTEFCVFVKILYLLFVGMIITIIHDKFYHMSTKCSSDKCGISLLVFLATYMKSDFNIQKFDIQA